jgi:hypothetical protein
MKPLLRTPHRRRPIILFILSLPAPLLSLLLLLLFLTLPHTVSHQTARKESTPSTSATHHRRRRQRCRTPLSSSATARANGMQRLHAPSAVAPLFFHVPLQNRFTGWVDSNLAEKGVAEAHHAATLLQDGGFTFDRVYSCAPARFTPRFFVTISQVLLSAHPRHPHG